MKIQRVPYTTEAAIDFYEAALAGLGADCTRSWHDRLEVLAEGPAAACWGSRESLFAGELHFAPADTATDRDAARDVFPGSPLTFALAEALRCSPVPLDRVVLAPDSRTSVAAPAPDVAEKLWRAQYPDTTRWRVATAFTRDHHFSLLALARCEIQAIDQTWALSRVVVDLATGAPDEQLAREFDRMGAQASPPSDLKWPDRDPARWLTWVRDALSVDLAPELESIQQRQQNRLAHEWQRIDAYFDEYERELRERSRRGASKARLEDRVAAARAERGRHRADQFARHEIVVHPHLDALILVAEPAWHVRLNIERAHTSASLAAQFLPRARRWIVAPS